MEQVRIKYRHPSEVLRTVIIQLNIGAGDMAGVLAVYDLTIDENNHCLWLGIIKDILFITDKKLTGS